MATPAAIPALFGPEEAAAVGVLGLEVAPAFAGTVFTTVCPGAVVTDAVVSEPDVEPEPPDCGSGALLIWLRVVPVKYTVHRFAAPPVRLLVRFSSSFRLVAYKILCYSQRRAYYSLHH